MCLADIYKEDNTLMMSNAARIDVDGKEITVRDLFGSVIRVEGSILSVDLERSTVLLRVEE